MCVSFVKTFEVAIQLQNGIKTVLGLKAKRQVLVETYIQLNCGVVLFFVQYTF